MPRDLWLRLSAALLLILALAFTVYVAVHAGRA